MIDFMPVFAGVLVWWEHKRKIDSFGDVEGTWEAADRMDPIWGGDCPGL